MHYFDICHLLPRLIGSCLHKYKPGEEGWVDCETTFPTGEQQAASNKISFCVCVRQSISMLSQDGYADLDTLMVLSASTTSTRRRNASRTTSTTIRKTQCMHIACVYSLSNATGYFQKILKHGCLRSLNLQAEKCSLPSCGVIYISTSEVYEAKWI